MKKLFLFLASLFSGNAISQNNFNLDEVLKNEKQEINISNQEVDNVSTDGGDVLIGAERLDKANLNIEKNMINKVKTGGGDFTIGSGRK